MWDRFRQKDGGASSMDRKKLEAWQNARSSSTTAAGGIKGGSNQYQYSIQGGAPPRPPRPAGDSDHQFEQDRGFLAAPSAHAAPAVRDSYRNSSQGRPVSSVYSQPSPDAATFAARQLRNEIVYSDPHQISPPSSPDISASRNGPDPGDVSPIDETPDTSQLSSVRQAPPEKDSRSNIPMMRRERRRTSDAAMKAIHEAKSRETLKEPRPHGNDVRWDPNTGEPTTSVKGRPSQINPHQFVHNLGSAPSPSSPPQAKNQGSSIFGERVRRARPPIANVQAEPTPRPGWRGASGRTALVPPVNDTKDVAPLNIPRKSSKRGGRGPGVLSPVDLPAPETPSNLAGRDSSSKNHNGSTEPVTTSTNKRDINPARHPKLPQAANTGSSPHTRSYPSPPLSDDNSVPPPRGPMSKAAQPPRAQPSLQPSSAPSNDKAIRRKLPSGTSHHPERSVSSSTYSQNDAQPSRAAPGAFPGDWTQPPSRFSISTNETSQQPTPRQSVDEDAPPVPTPPQQSTSAAPKPTPGVSILDRKRPMVPGYEQSPKQQPAEPVKINLDSEYYMTSSPGTKPRPSGSRVVPRGNESVLSVAASVLSTDKTLPPAPPEAQSHGRVAQLNARLEALGNRRININTAIKQMTELMPTDNILASEEVVRKREAEKRKVEALRVELADVERESYELGLKLHRAYKRMDRDAEYEPTTLWVRRVTG
ncbi:hypothetical protein F4775DRAFT_310857 [Biscogniauxia sp. FL1348]|nr:hypothetical protein F4775DRAFT_310857 [Biscogniauxia sp. FL1348]